MNTITQMELVLCKHMWWQEEVDRHAANVGCWQLLLSNNMVANVAPGRNRMTDFNSFDQICEGFF